MEIAYFVLKMKYKFLPVQTIVLDEEFVNISLFSNCKRIWYPPVPQVYPLQSMTLLAEHYSMGILSQAGSAKSSNFSATVWRWFLLELKGNFNNDLPSELSDLWTCDNELCLFIQCLWNDFDYLRYLLNRMQDVVDYERRRLTKWP